MAQAMDDVINISDSDSDDIVVMQSVSRPSARKRQRTLGNVENVIPVVDDENGDEAAVEVIAGRTFVDTADVFDKMSAHLDEAMVEINNALKHKKTESKSDMQLLKIHGMSETEPISRTSARLLLNHFNWDVHKLIQNLKSSSLEKLFSDCNVVNPRSYFLQLIKQDAVDGQGSGTCGIMAYCDDELKETDLFYVKPCNHTFCFECLQQHVITTINDNQAVVDRIPCPQPGCQIVLSDYDVVQLICHGNDVVIASEKVITNTSAPSSETPLSKYYRVIGTKFVEHHEYLTLCPSANCSKVAQLYNNPSTEAIECPDCLALFCFPCGRNWHEPLTCAQMKEFEAFDDKNLTWIKKKTKDCPKCKSPIEKNHGCNHMTCTRCNHQFCWMCFATWPCNGQCMPAARQLTQKKNQDYKYQLSVLKNVNKSVKALTEKYTEEQKLRKKILQTSEGRWIMPQKVSRTVFRSLVRELGLCRLFLITCETFTVLYRVNKRHDDIFQEKTVFEGQVNSFASTMASELDKEMNIVDVARECEAKRKFIFGLMEDGIQDNVFESVGSSQPIAGPSVPGQPAPAVPGPSTSYISSVVSAATALTAQITATLRTMVEPFSMPAPMELDTTPRPRGRIARRVARGGRGARRVARGGRDARRAASAGRAPVPTATDPTCTCIMCS